MIGSREMETASGLQDSPEYKAIVALRGGGSLVSCKPVFTPDSRYLLYGSGHSVKVSSVVSGECVKILHGHKSAVTSIIINPVNQFQALTAASDSSLIKWDIQDGMLLARYTFHASLSALYPSHCVSETSTFYAIQVLDEQHNTLVKFSLSKQKADETVNTQTVMRDVDRAVNMLDIGCEDSYIAAAKVRTLRIYDTRRNHTKELRWEGKHKMTCVTCHPTEFCVATGLTDGRIVLWRNFLADGSENTKVIKTVLQWHVLPVRDLKFTVEGSCLLSVGYECVLVKWQMNSEQRDTLPRLGAPICFIACSADNQLYATCHSDNGIQVITSNFKITQLYQGLVQGYRDQQVKSGMAVGLMLDSRSGALVANGRPGQLQFYHPSRDEQLFCLDITGQNYVSPDSLKHPLVLTEIERAAMESKGDWLVTYERRSDGVLTDEMRLKFWSYSVTDKTFVLNTTVNVPHSRKVETIQFRPVSASSRVARASGDDDDDDDGAPMVVTTSSDGTFKLWKLVDDTDIYRTNVRWSCESVGSYRNLACGPASFSQDGSLLAVGFSDVMTLWSPASNSLRHAVSLGGQDFNIRQLVFGQNQASHILYITTNDHLYAWNVLSGMVEYNISQSISQLLIVPGSDNVAIFTDTNSLIAINGTTGRSIYVRANVSSAILSAIFVPSDHSTEGELGWMGKNRLYFITESQELLTLVYEEEDSTVGYSKLERQLPMTAFSALMAEKKKSEVIKQTDERWRERTNKQDKLFYNEMLSTPLHVLPPMSSICNKFLETLMVKHSTSSQEDEGNSSDSDSEEDSEHSNEDSEDSDSDGRVKKVKENDLVEKMET